MLVRVGRLLARTGVRAVNSLWTRSGLILVARHGATLIRR